MSNSDTVPPIIETPRLYLRLLEPDEADLAVAFYLGNKEHLEKTGPRWTSDFFDLERWRLQLEVNLDEFRTDQSLKLFIFEKQTDSIIGFVNFNNIVRRVAQYCNIGYSLAQNKQGHGFMEEALRHSIKYSFQVMNLHRVMANYMPHNVRSGNVLKKLGFTAEGFARDYLFIHGRWEDHVLTSLTNDNWHDAL
ncbi:GNAT family N-acetyltransferase [soil metagenome]